MRRSRVVWLALLAVSLLAPSLRAADTATLERLPATVVPVPKTDANWQKRHALMNERVAKGDVDLLLIGDSITQGWEGAGRKVWQEYYGDRNAVNLGIGGDQTQHVLWRLQNGNIEGISPKLAVLMIGTNNSGGNKPEEIAAGIKKIVETIRTKTPKTKILVLGIFPRGAKSDDRLRQVNTKTNEIVSKLADGDMVKYLDIGQNFLKDDGTLTKDIMPDLLHLSPQSYQIWAEAIEPEVAKVMGPKKAAAAGPNPYLGNWALTIPGGGAGWLGVTEKNGRLSANLLWGGGSVVPVADAKMEGDQLVLHRMQETQRTDASGKKTRAQMVETITAKANGDALSLTIEGGRGSKRDFTGKRTPPVPAAPDLAKVKFAEPIQLFNGKDLAGWRLTSPGQANGWSAEDGVLVNRPVQEEGKPHKSYGNLRTDREFEDFNLTLETRVGKGENSGIYLRGIYEVQVSDSYGRKLDSHNMGGLYSRITPTANAEKPVGEWQTFDITLVDRHVTVILNGKKIIDNQPLLGCTGGALWSDEFRPGPIYLQGDHTGIEYRNIVIRPVVK